MYKRQVTKGVPADREIQFFGFTDYRGQGEEDTSGEGDGVDYEDYSYYEEEGMQDGKDEEDKEEERTSSGGMSNVEKALVAAEVAMLGKKVHGFVRGRKDGSGTEDQSTIRMKMKNAGNRAKMAGKKVYHRVGDGMKSTLGKGKNVGRNCLLYTSPSPRD